MISDPFHFPYASRILAADSTGSAIELFRSKKPIQPSEYRSILNSLQGAWDRVWIERVTPERELVSPRNIKSIFGRPQPRPKIMDPLAEIGRAIDEGRPRLSYWT